MNSLRKVALVIAAGLALAAPADAQWQVPNHAVPVGQGGGNIGFNSAVPSTSGVPLVSSGSSADPIFGPISNAGFGTVPADTTKCNPTGGAAAVQDCTASQLSAMLAAGNLTTITSTYPVATTDCGKTIVAGGSAFYTITIGPASGFPASCPMAIANTDNVCPALGAATCRGKRVSIDGYASFILWPGQVVSNIDNQSNVWRYRQPGRWLPLVTMQWFVNHGLGNNNNDGLATGSGAFATMQRCVDVMESLIDFGQADSGPVCQNDPETFTENNVVHTHPLTGYHVISINGNVASPGTVTWQVSGTGNVGVQCRDGGAAIVTGFTMVSTGTANTFINGGQLGVCDFGAMIFGANAGGYDINQSPGGAMNFNTGQTMSVTGSMAGFALVSGEGHMLLDNMQVTMPNALTFTNWIQVQAPGFVSATNNGFTGVGSGAGSTGKKFSVQYNGVLSLGASSLPGNAAGTTSNGGQQF